MFPIRGSATLPSDAAPDEPVGLTPPLERLGLPYLVPGGMRHYLNQLLHANARPKDCHHILTKVERLTASCGLEGRAPRFDHAVVECAFAIPPWYRLAATQEKWALKQAVRDLADDLLLGPRAQARGLFQPALIRAWLRGAGSPYPRQRGKLWLVLTPELWLRAYLDRAELDADDFARRPRRLWACRRIQDSAVRMQESWPHAN